MKNSASRLLKHISFVLSSLAKAQLVAIKSQTDALKSRLIMFSMLKNKKLPFGAISHKIHAILGQQHKGGHLDIDSDQSEAIVLYNALANEPQPSSSHTQAQLQLVEKAEDDYYYYDDDDKYPNLTRSLFNNNKLDLGDPNGSVIDLVRSSKEDGENFSLEDEIDHVADLFIMKFHKRMRLQKMESFKRYQDMLERST